jgi:hypothetical protein
MQDEKHVEMACRPGADSCVVSFLEDPSYLSDSCEVHRGSVRYIAGCMRVSSRVRSRSSL